jgi:hypothetical protein
VRGKLEKDDFGCLPFNFLTLSGDFRFGVLRRNLVREVKRRGGAQAIPQHGRTSGVDLSGLESAASSYFAREVAEAR